MSLWGTLTGLDVVESAGAAVATTVNASARGPAGAILSLIWYDAQFTVLRDYESFTEVADGSGESWYYVAGSSPPEGAVRYAAVAADGTVWGAEEYTNLPLNIDAQLSATHGAGSWTGGGASGTGNIAVTHNTGGTDNLQFVTPGGEGINGATVTAYLQSDWLAGNTGTDYVLGNTITGPDGRWINPIMLDSGFTYTITFYKQGVYNMVTATITI